MAASGPSQAKHTAKESSGEERRVGETGGEEKESRALAKTRGEGGETWEENATKCENFGNKRWTVLQTHPADTWPR